VGCGIGGGGGGSGRGSLALMRCQSAASTLSAQLGLRESEMEKPIPAGQAQPSQLQMK